MGTGWEQQPGKLDSQSFTSPEPGPFLFIKSSFMNKPDLPDHVQSIINIKKLCKYIRTKYMRRYFYKHKCYVSEGPPVVKLSTKKHPLCICVN